MSTKEPWLSLLCYDHTKASKLEQVARNGRLELHPVSGEVEVDWETEIEIHFKRVDEETLQALATLPELELNIRLVWCVGDQGGGGDGWRIGEVSVLDKTDVSECGQESIAEAEEKYKLKVAQSTTQRNGDLLSTNSSRSRVGQAAEEEEDDDDYWQQYDNTSAQTPAVKCSPAPNSRQTSSTTQGDEDSYYEQYAQVQPAMDNDDPDEAHQNGDVETSLGKDEITSELRHNLDHHDEFGDASRAWSEDMGQPPPYLDGTASKLAQPRLGSSTGSSGEDTVARLERTAAVHTVQAQAEMGVKQHIGTSVKSLYRLARVAGIETEEFERLVRTELDCLGLMEEDVD